MKTTDGHDIISRVRLFGKNCQDIEELIGNFSLDLSDEEPEAIICYGGDGTLLRSEQKWPGLPKVILRDSGRCRTCSHHSNEEIVEQLSLGKLKKNRFLKLSASLRDTKIVSMNDINIHNANITAGVRYRLWIDNEAYASGQEIVGDGLVAASPFGSSAYYRSITSSTFRVGIGLAFNNSTEPIDHLVLAEDSIIHIEITRGPAILAGDNYPKQQALEIGDEIDIQRADHDAIILTYNNESAKG